jgi:hypothetical protein
LSCEGRCNRLSVFDMKRSVSGSTHWCALCGLPIPIQIVSMDHPLMGTVEHLIPKSRGGQNRLDNRVAAHRYCNARKGRSISLSIKEQDLLEFMIAKKLTAIGRPPDNHILQRARLRRIDFSSDPRILAELQRRDRIGNGKAPNKLPHIQRWEDDGGTAT